MNLLQLYLGSVGVSFSFHEYMIIRNNYRKMKKSKKHIKQKKGLNSKKVKALNKENLQCLLILNGISLGFAITPFLNVISIPYFFNRKSAYDLVGTCDNDSENQKLTLEKK